MNIVLRLAWRNLWRHARRTWLTIGAMVFSNILLVFMMSLQFGMYGLMIDNTLQVFSGHMQIQAPGYKDDQKMRQVVPGVQPLAATLRRELNSDLIAARGQGFRPGIQRGAQLRGRHLRRGAGFRAQGLEHPGLVKAGRYLVDNNAMEIVIGEVLARNLRVTVGDELTLLGSGVDGSFAAAVVEIVGVFESGVKDIDRNIAEMPLGAFPGSVLHERRRAPGRVVCRVTRRDGTLLQQKVEAAVAGR